MTEEEIYKYYNDNGYYIEVYTGLVKKVNRIVIFKMVDGVLTIIKEEYILTGSLNDTLLSNYFIESMNTILIQEEREEKLTSIIEKSKKNNDVK